MSRCRGLALFDAISSLLRSLRLCTSLHFSGELAVSGVASSFFLIYSLGAALPVYWALHMEPRDLCGCVIGLRGVGFSFFTGVSECPWVSLSALHADKSRPINEIREAHFNQGVGSVIYLQ